MMVWFIGGLLNVVVWIGFGLFADYCLCNLRLLALICLWLWVVMRVGLVLGPVDIVVWLFCWVLSFV